MREFEPLNTKRRHIMGTAALLLLVSGASAQPATQWCGELEFAILRPPSTGDRITVTHDFGAPYRWMLASLDSSGRAILLTDPRRPRETLVAKAEPQAFVRLLGEARRAEEAHRNRPEPDRPQFDTTTLEGLLDAVRAGAEATCPSNATGLKRSIYLHIDGEETFYYCITDELAEFSQEFVALVERTIEGSGGYLCQ